MYYNNKEYYFGLIEIGFTEFLEIRELNQMPDRDIIEDVVESFLGTKLDVSFEHQLVMERDAILIRVWSNTRVHASMYKIPKNGQIPISKPNSLFDVLCNYSYSFGSYKSTAQSPSSSKVSSSKALPNNLNKKDAAATNNTKDDKYNTTCNKCGSLAYVGLNNFRCSKGCK